MYQSQMSECVRRNSISAGRYTYIHTYIYQSKSAFWVGTRPAVFAGRRDFSLCCRFFGPCILGGYASRCFCRPLRYFILFSFRFRFSSRCLIYTHIDIYIYICTRVYASVCICYVFWTLHVLWTLRYFCSGFLPLWIEVWSTPATSAFIFLVGKGLEYAPHSLL